MKQNIENLKNNIVEQAFVLTEQFGWNNFPILKLQETFTDDKPLFRSVVKNKTDVFKLICESMERFVKENQEIESKHVNNTMYDSMSIDDLFNTMMLHFDFLTLHKEAILLIEKTIRNNPEYLYILTQYLSHTSIIETVNLPHRFSFIKHSLTDKFAIASIFFYTYHSWRKDSSPDMSLTMARLDRLLSKMIKNHVYSNR